MKRRAILIISVAMVILFVVLPITYGLSFFYALHNLQFGTPTISVSRNGFDVYVTLNIPVKNPTGVSLPTLEVFCEATLNGHMLLHGEHNVVSLDSGKELTLTFTTIVNVDLLADMFWTLVDFLSGKSVSYSITLNLSVHFLTDITISSMNKIGTFKL